MLFCEEIDTIVKRLAQEEIITFARKRKYQPTRGSRANIKLTYFAVNYQDPAKLCTFF